jgi:DNA polymerase-4
MRKIIHIDMDCFYAGVEEKYHPELRGKPLGIGGPPNSRSVLCTANYEARKYGVKAAIPSSLAVRLCPQLILRPPNFELYKSESLKVREIFERFTSKIEPLSLDEAYLDVTESSHFQGSATLIAKEIKRLIKSEINLIASAGVAPNKFLAKVASDWNKPDGLFVIRPLEVEAFVKRLPIEKIFGVGKVTAGRLHALGIKNCEDIQKLSELELQRNFGSRAQEYFKMARGIDDRPIITNWVRKSLSVEETFSKDISTLQEALRQIPDLYSEWLKRFERSSLDNQIRGWSLKLKFSDFTQTTLEIGAQSRPSAANFNQLLERAWQRKAEPVRLIGIGVKLSSKKTDPPQDDLDLPLFQCDFVS